MVDDSRHAVLHLGHPAVAGVPDQGFVLDDQRLKQAGDGNYFDELLARNRDAFGDREISSKMYLPPFRSLSIDSMCGIQIAPKGSIR